MDHALADLDGGAEVAGLTQAPAQRDRGPDPEDAAGLGLDQRLELEDRVVQAALALEGPGDDEPAAVGELGLGGEGGTVHDRASLGLRLEVLAGLQGELGEVERQLELVVLAGGDAAQQVVDRHLEARGQVGEDGAVGTALPRLDPRHVADRDVAAGELGLGPALRHAGGADPVSQLCGVDLLQEVSVP